MQVVIDAGCEIERGFGSRKRIAASEIKSPKTRKHDRLFRCAIHEAHELTGGSVVSADLAATDVANQNVVLKFSEARRRLRDAPRLVEVALRKAQLENARSAEYIHVSARAGTC